MSDCHHVFIGRADGVHCTRCGLHLTAQQYHELLHPPETPAGRAERRRRQGTHRTPKSHADGHGAAAGKTQAHPQEEGGDRQ